MTAAIGDLLPAGLTIVVCGRSDDSRAWTDLIGASRCLPIALDAATPEALPRLLTGASDELTWQYRTIAGLDGSGWLARPADRFDPGHQATLVLPDPLDPPAAGDRRRLGRRRAAWRLFENKTSVDGLWDAIGLPRAPAVICDPPTDVGPLGSDVDAGSGVVCSCQGAGGTPTAGGDGIWWWRTGQPPPGIPGLGTSRIRLMPLLEGPAIRLHGLVLDTTVVTFPPMEIVALPRPASGTFQCSGAVATLDPSPELAALTKRIGAGLRDNIGYLGGYSVDGILTASGFRPTDLNARLTSAIEAAPCDIRVQLHLANLLAREGIDPPVATVESIRDQTFAAIGESHTLYGAARRLDPAAPRQLSVRWSGTTLDVAMGERADGQLTVRPSMRGWLITATLAAGRLPTTGPLGPLAPAVFALSDRVLGTDFGDLKPPFGVPPAFRS
jgi:hypothetical protein